MKRLLKTVAWVLYAVGMVLFFAYRLFPEEPFRLLVQEAVGRKTGMEMRLAGMSLGFPATLHLRQVDLTRDGVRLSLEHVGLRPALLALVLGEVGGKMRVRGLGGQAEAKLKMRPASPLEARGSLRLEGLDMAMVTALLPKPLPLGVKGRMSGRFGCTPEGEKLAVSGTLDFEGGDLVVDLPLVENLGLRLISAQLESHLQQEGLEIKNLVVSGSFGTLQLQGAMRPPAGPGARLELSGGIRPDPAFLQQLTRMGGIGPVIGRFVGQREIPVRVAGTLERPQVSLAGMRL